jgi:DNA-binding protein HU-beta
MTKNELAAKVAESAGIGVGQARSAVDAVFDTIASQLASGGEVSVAGFGKFGVSHRAARTGRNPATGSSIEIASSKAAKFSAASALKHQLNSLPGDSDEDY